MERKIILFLALIYGVDSQRVQLSCQQIRQFVDLHNLHRQTVALGFLPRQPAASNMNYIVWDEELAEKAARWADNGLFGHNPDRTVLSKRWDLIGENVYYNQIYSPFGFVTPNINEATNTWFTEHMKYSFEPYSLKIGPLVGHYTQMVWGDTTKFGCGISQKKENGWVTTLFVCDYGPTGNWIGKTPYKTQTAQGHLQCAIEECEKPYGVRC